MTYRESRDRAAIRALAEIDSELADLFVRGRSLCGEPDGPALAYLIAHVGRELTNGIVRALEPNAPGAPLLDNEQLAARIAKALGLSVRHSIVRDWARLHRVFHGAAHVRSTGAPGPDVAPLRPAFARLADLLYGLVGDYFQTQAEIDALADTGDPATIRIHEVRNLLFRPVQRRRFFSRLSREEWLDPLAKAGMFVHPPERIVHEDGSWQAREWPEGAYLIRMAPLAPTRVVAILRQISDGIDNPAVWRIVADAIVALPAERGAELARKLAGSLALGFPSIYAYNVLDAAIALARARRVEAFILAGALLEPGDIRLPPPSTISNADYAEQVRERRRAMERHDEWVLPRIEEYTLRQTIEQLLPLLEAIDAERTINLLMDRVERTTLLVARAVQLYSAALTQLDALSNDTVDLFDIDEPEIDSRRWCRSLVHADIMDSTRALLARETFKRCPGYTKLARKQNEIFRRMLLARLAQEKTLDADRQARVDEFVGSEEAVDPSFGAVETAALLRAHFERASQGSQRAFIGALERGPGDEYATRLIEFREETDTPEARREIVEDWQRRRIRWFHDRIPAMLLPLATKLRVVAHVPSRREQDLDETGSWFGGVSSGGARSPIGAEELGAMSPDDFVRFLVTWHPAGLADDPFDTPSLEGLETAVRTIAAQSPDFVGSVLPAFKTVEVPLRYVTALAAGLRSAIEQKRKVTLRLVTILATQLWTRAERSPYETTQERQLERWAGDAVTQLLRAYIARGRLRLRQRDALWKHCLTLAVSPLTWREDPDETPAVTYREATHRSSAALSGSLMEMILALAWTDFMVAHAKTTWPPPGASSTSAKLVPILEAVMAREGSSAAAARGTIARHVNQLLWMAYDWTVANVDRLFGSGFSDPGAHPGWAAFVQSANLQPAAFHIVRPWFARFAAWLPVNGDAPSQDPEWALAEPFANLVTWACLFGHCAPEDSDRVIENTFSRVPVKARAHAYWSIMSSFSKARRINPALPTNAVRLWESRMDALEKAPATTERDEEVDSLTQLIGVRHLPITDTIRLGQRTTALLRRKQRVTSMAWDRLATLAEHDPEGTLAIVQRLVHSVLDGEFPYLSFDDVAPALRTAIAQGGELRERALALVHRIGSAGFTEFDVLWKEATQ